jgi:hypothetical protein
MSFTTGGLFVSESVMLAEIYGASGDWAAVRDEAVKSNLLQVRTESSSKRIAREVISRLKLLSAAELTLLIHSGIQDQASLLWVAVCSRYKFIAEFSVEVLRERFITLKPDLGFEEFDAFFNRKCEWHPELDSIKPATRNKLRQVLFRMMREAGLITPSNMIVSPMLSPALVAQIKDLSIFPVLESGVRRKA